ncbi:VWA domain-containing protein [Cellvibrio sp. NN19]|uniref:vWA domain-containing protein n=1 Tax=Cellvibrio chitinivorans TaxID=3102792 RepID=UPI002B40DF63|nr:VWA domain-containing protein [Cellvibrio sp. NN19]
MFEFEYIWAFILLPLPLLVWWLFPPHRERTQAVRVPFFEQAAEVTGIKPQQGAVEHRANWAQRLLAPICWILCIAALARPQWVQPPVEHFEAARDLLLAIDLSQSMEARDYNLNGEQVDRLTAVKSVVDDFIQRRTTDRIGLIVFGQAAFPQAPLTLDHETVRLLLAETRIGMAGPQTAIGDAIGVAIKMTERAKTQEKVLVLLTDGNDTASRLPPERAAEIAKDNQITIHTIGIGDVNAEGENKVDLDALQQIAAATGGRSFRAENQSELEQIYTTIDGITPDKAKHLEYRARIDLFWVPLAAYACLLAFYHLIALLFASLRRSKSGAGAEASRPHMDSGGN